jgi:hypothetical protein
MIVKGSILKRKRKKMKKDDILRMRWEFTEVTIPRVEGVCSPHAGSVKLRYIPPGTNAYLS